MLGDERNDGDGLDWMLGDERNDGGGVVAKLEPLRIDGLDGWNDGDGRDAIGG